MTQATRKLSLALAALTGCASWPEVEIREPACVYTSEAGAGIAIEVTLSARPTHAIDVWAVSSDADEARVSGAVRFRRSNWDQAQIIEVTGVDDVVCDGDRAYGIAIYARWHDDPSGGYLVDEVYLINRDDDCPERPATTHAPACPAMEDGG